MTVLRLLCFVGIHPRRGWEFVGSSWQPNDYVRVCVECGREMPLPVGEREQRGDDTR